jgi:SAM-dependent methyltransferase
LKEFFKHILKLFRIYHPLQSFYRNSINHFLRIKYRKEYRSYKGSGYQCNVCGSTYSKFVPDYPSAENEEAIVKHAVVAGYGEDVYCPNCLSTARERLVIAFIKDKINVRDKRVLHFSPEKYVYDFLKSNAIVVTADLIPGFYRTIDKTIQHQNATGLEYEDNSFDLVIANHILEHIPDDRKAMQEIFRVLKPAGVAIMQVPYSEMIHQTIESPDINEPALQSKLYGQKDHVRIYAIDDYVSRLKSSGFDIKEYTYEMLSDYYKYAIQPKEKFLLMSKPNVSA